MHAVTRWLAVMVCLPAMSLLVSAWTDCTSQPMYDAKWGMEAATNLTLWKSSLLSLHTGSYNDTDIFDEKRGHARYDAYNPVVTCPPGRNLTRYGHFSAALAGDGTKLLCDIDQDGSDASHPCIVVSMGSNGDYSFERSVLDQTNCVVHTYDCTFNGVSQDPERHHYHKVCIGNPSQGADYQSWGEIATNLHGLVDVLKADVEGYETLLFAELRPNVPLPEQLVVELHIAPSYQPLAFGPYGARNAVQLALVVSQVANLGYAPIAREDNMNPSAVPGCCSELTFLLVEEYGPPRSGLGQRRRHAKHHNLARYVKWGQPKR